MIFNEAMDPMVGFNQECAADVFNSLSTEKNAPFVRDLTHCFVVSKMTNLEDLARNDKYECLLYVEFLECLCRVSIMYWDYQIEIGNTKFLPRMVEDKVYSILEMLWESQIKKRKSKKKPEKGAKKKKRKKKEFPELVEIQDDFSDDD